jgi:hypothetical protein
MAMLTRRLQPNQAVQEHLSEHVKRLRKEALIMPHGAARERLTRLARQAESGAEMSAWLRSRRSQSPK